MAWFDLEGDELRSHTTSVTAPQDLREFWDARLAEATAAATAPTVSAHEPGLYRGLDAFDVTFSGAHGHPVKAWLMRPRSDSPSPVLVGYLGWGGGRGVPADHTYWAAAGFAYLLMDARGQGGVWGPGSTGDPVDEHSAAPEVPGVVSRGVVDPRTYYYTRLWTDAARAVATVADLEETVGGLDTSWIGVTGGSQGGAMAIAAAALMPEQVRWLQAEMPFMAEARRAIRMVDTAPYKELSRYLCLYPEHLPAVERTLSYVDATVLAGWVTAPAVMTVGLMDQVCPPSTAYAVFNALASTDKRIEEFEFVGHETPPPWQEGRIRAAHAALAASRATVAAEAALLAGAGSRG